MLKIKKRGEENVHVQRPRQAACFTRRQKWLRAQTPIGHHAGRPTVRTGNPSLRSPWASSDPRVQKPPPLPPPLALPPAGEKTARGILPQMNIAGGRGPLPRALRPPCPRPRRNEKMIIGLACKIKPGRYDVRRVAYRCISPAEIGYVGQLVGSPHGDAHYVRPAMVQCIGSGRQGLRLRSTERLARAGGTF